ncbi:hypothetical protein IRT45_32310 [Nocardia sp. BSTN01]|uniref:hypothetical protein n=1 Tax=Nocardia sp. BSTN01 TaxID=2783665 RepID=UPI00189050E6|nr:hypothetical protein [Nocardia sp. BSTN01]MBF5001814.1 hypothetical protein [Nocardia sp. BSTN01]
MSTAVSLPQLAIGEEVPASPRRALYPASAPADSFADSQRYYENLYGPTRYDANTRALTVRAHAFRALMVTRDLADVASEALHGQTLPIFAVRHGIRVLMTAPPTAADDIVRFFPRGVTIVGRAAELALPTPGNPTRWWLAAFPEGAELPPYHEVVEAVLGACSG